MTLINIAPKLLNDLQNYELRADLMFSATMALNGIVRSGATEDWATHNIEHEVSAYYDIPHGLGLAIITPNWMKEVYKTKLSKFAQYGSRIWGLSGSDEDIALKSIIKTAEFFTSLGIKMKLSDWGIDESKFNVITTKLENNKIGEFPLTKQQILNILNACK